MSVPGPQTLNIADLEAAVSAAVEHVQGQKLSAAGLLRGPIIAGRYIREAAALTSDAEQGLKQAADAVTKQVNAKNPGLNATSLLQSGPGHIILGITFREE